MAATLEFGDLGDGVGHAFPGILVHRQGVQGDVGARPGVLGGGKVVGVGFAGDFEHRHGQLFRQGGARGEPVGFGPASQHAPGVRIAVFGALLNIVEGVENQQDVAKLVRRGRRHFAVVEQLNERCDIVAAEHRAEQPHRRGAVDQGGFRPALGERGKKARLDVGGLVNAGRHPVGDQIEQECFFPGWRIFEQFHQVGDLGGGQRQRRDAEFGPLANVLSIFPQQAQALL